MADAPTVREVSGRRELKAFIRYPWTIYRSDRCWVPPLIMDEKKLFDRERNPFCRHAEIALFLAWRDGRPAGRIAAMVDRRYNEFHGERSGSFGFFECPDEPETAAALVAAARDWVTARGMERWWGPLNFSTNRCCGLLVDGFDRPPRLFMPYNPPYYERLLLDQDLKPAKDLLAYRRDGTLFPEKVRRIQEKVKERRGVTIRPINLKRYEEELAVVSRIYNGAWEKNWGFVPMSEEEFAEMGREMKPILDPELVLIASVAGEAAGFCLAVPDVNQALKRLNGRLLPFGWLKLLWGLKKVDACRLLALGILREHRKRGIDSILYTEVFDRAVRRRYRQAELSWVLEDNVMMNRGIEAAGGRVEKRYRLYEQILSGASGSAPP